MLPYGARDLANAFRTVRKNTLQILEEIPNDRLGYVPATDTRSIGQLLNHIAFGDEFAYAVHKHRLKSLTTLDFPELMKRLMLEEQQPRDKAAFLILLTKRGEDFATWLETLTDDFLSGLVEMPPGAQPLTKTRFEMLMSVKEHEMHHRGQLMLILRLLGLVPPLTRQRQEQMAALATETSK